MSDTLRIPVGPCLTDTHRHADRQALDAHGTLATYRRGCRCLLCRCASARSRSDYRDPRSPHYKPRYADAPQGV